MIMKSTVILNNNDRTSERLTSEVFYNKLTEVSIDVNDSLQPIFESAVNT